MTSKQIQAIKIAIECVEPDVAHELEKLLKAASKESVPQEWVEQWLQLWPTKGEVYQFDRSISYSPRSSLPETMAKFNKLLKNLDKACPNIKGKPLEEKLAYAYAATENYLRGRERDNWRFVGKATLFINHEQKGSKLCDEINEIFSKPKQSKFEYYG